MQDFIGFVTDMILYLE